MFTLIRFYPGDRGLDLLLAATLGVALASSAAWLIARRLAGQPALRHLVLFAALLCCLASPAAACFRAATGLTLVSIPLLRGEQVRTASGDAQIQTDPVWTPPRPSTDPPLVAAGLPLPDTNTTIDQSAGVAAPRAARESLATSTPSAPGVHRAGSVAETPLSFRETAAGAMFVWAAGALLMLAHLLRNCWGVVQLRRSSRPLPNESHQLLLQEIAARLGMRQVPLLLVSSRTVTPLAVGFGRPAVILPECILGAVSDSELRDVLMHEAAHLQRGDQRIVLLQELAGALYWPIVSVHALNRELRRASEELCDNVVLAGRNAISYCETLLHIAELLVNARPMRAAVGIVGGQGELERRVAGLIDPRRNTMTTTGRKAHCFVLFLFIAVGSLLSAMRFAASAAPESDGPQPPAEPSVSATAQPGKAPREADSKRTIVLRGKVLGPGDRPIAGARLYLSVDEWTDPIELGTSDVKGAYRLAVPEKTLRRSVFPGNLQYEDCQASLIVAANGFGPGWEELPDAKGSRWGETWKPEYAHDFHLAADFPIAGQIVDAGGKPVAGAVVAVDRIHSLSDGRWHKMHPAIKARDANFMTRRQTDVSGWWSPVYPTAWKRIPPATTDAEGRFCITGVGGDRAIRLNVTGPGIRSNHVSVLTRDDVADFTQKIRTKYPRDRRPHGYFYPEREGAPEGDQGVLLFGPSPTIEVDPARTVAGVVRDAGTGEPIAGLRMKTTFSNDTLGGGEARTDRRGRYRLLRVEDRSSIWVYTDLDHSDRCLNVARRLSNTKGLGEIVADLDVPRGVVVTGRVLESGSNRPIVSAPTSGEYIKWPGPLRTGYVYYFPLSTNTALRGTPSGLYFEGFQTGTNFCTSADIGADGRFRLAVPPGPGVLLVRSSPGMPPRATGFLGFLHGECKESEGVHRLFPYTKLTTRARDDGAPAGDAKSLPGFTGPIPLENYHAYRVINPPADAKTLDFTLTVPRRSRVVCFVGPDGRAMKGVKVKGLVDPSIMIEVVLDGSEAEILALVPGKPREVTAASSDGKYIATTSVSGDDLRPATIRLKAAGSITGRIVDENGKPVKALLSHPQQTKLALDVGMIPLVESNAEGRFHIAPLLPGRRYSGEIFGGERNTQRVGTAFENVVLRAGEVRDLGDVRIKATVDAKSGNTPGN